MELLRVRLHAAVGGDDLGTVEVPVGWLWRGDLLVDREGQLVRVVEFVELPAGGPIAALVKVAPAIEISV